ncbi:MAG: hypothetical protein HC828_11365 [Blastochloris sp.]|nr:hypothetical protein [Blastochloris sp.]
MEQITPEFLFYLFVGLLHVVAFVIIVNFWKEIGLTLKRVGQLIRAIWRRYITVSWSDIMSIIADDKTEKTVVADRNNNESRTTTTPIAKANNDNNTSLLVVEDAKIEALALLIRESKRKSFMNGIVPETRGMEALFGVKASSTSVDYKRLQAKLKKALDRLDVSETKERDQIVEVKGREVIRENDQGQRYTMVNGKKVEV